MTARGVMLLLATVGRAGAGESGARQDEVELKTGSAPYFMLLIGMVSLFYRVIIALGGNKTWKHEFLLDDAPARGADVVVTGGAQSNNCR